VGPKVIYDCLWSTFYIGGLIELGVYDFWFNTMELEMTDSRKNAINLFLWFLLLIIQFKRLKNKRILEKRREMAGICKR